MYYCASKLKDRWDRVASMVQTLNIISKNAMVWWHTWAGLCYLSCVCIFCIFVDKAYTYYTKPRHPLGAWPARGIESVHSYARSWQRVQNHMSVPEAHICTLYGISKSKCTKRQTNRVQDGSEHKVSYTVLVPCNAIKSVLPIHCAAFTK